MCAAGSGVAEKSEAAFGDFDICLDAVRSAECLVCSEDFACSVASDYIEIVVIVYDASYSVSYGAESLCFADACHNCCCTTCVVCKIVNYDCIVCACGEDEAGCEYADG